MLPSDIDMRRQVGSIFENMARHQEVLERFVGIADKFQSSGEAELKGFLW